MLKKDKLLQIFNWVRLFDFVVIHLSGQSGGRSWSSTWLTFTRGGFS